MASLASLEIARLLENFPLASTPKTQLSEIQKQNLEVVIKALQNGPHAKLVPSAILCKCLDEFEKKMKDFVTNMCTALQPNQQSKSMSELMETSVQIQKKFEDLKGYYRVCSLQFDQSFDFAKMGTSNEHCASKAYMMYCLIEKQELKAIHHLQELAHGVYSMCCLQKDFLETTMNQPEENKLCMQLMCQNVFHVLSKPLTCEERNETCRSVALTIATHCMQNSVKAAHSEKVNKLMCVFGSVCGDFMERKSTMKRDIDAMRLGCYFRQNSLSICCGDLVVKEVTENPVEEPVTGMSLLSLLERLTKNASVVASKNTPHPLPHPAVVSIISHGATM
ncbi:hypothetical protein CYMTET_53805 [Cymbomonas tetramitiformis]|uniref:Uncharacterized protein n=1 Tax=Cymbomonas tetramitiformis TaxID=36881 RepID=A0AAE0BI04_9CHLO|nr:hypothetical protein CYMTET_53805 [Cymbomonas tetramitiformis]